MLVTRKAQELDVVELTEDLPEFGLKRGERGAVVSAFDEPDEAYDLEFVDESGQSKFAYSVKPQQIKVHSTSAMTIAPQTVFLSHGRNPIWLGIEEFLRNRFTFEVKAWDRDSRAGRPRWDILKKLLDECRFAVIVVTAEDVSPPEAITRSRPNVVHEIGLFQGRLGFERVALLLQEGAEGIFNFSGLQYISFSGERVDQSFHEIEEILRQEGFISEPQDLNTRQEFVKERVT